MAVPAMLKWTVQAEMAAAVMVAAVIPLSGRRTTLTAKQSVALVPFFGPLDGQYRSGGAPCGAGRLGLTPLHNSSSSISQMPGAVLDPLPPIFGAAAIPSAS
jgi:hypothetical protein